MSRCSVPCVILMFQIICRHFTNITSMAQEGEYAANIGPIDQSILLGVTTALERMNGRMERQAVKTIVSHLLQHGNMDEFREAPVR